MTEPSAAGRQGAPEALTALDLLRIAAAIGILAGFGELVLLGIQKLCLGRLVFLGRDVLWMTPLAGAASFTLVTVPFALWLRARPGARVVPAAVGCCVGLGLLSALLMYRPLHQGAALLLATGLGVQTARWLRPRLTIRSGLSRLARRSLPALAGLVLVLASGVVAGRRLAELRAVARVPVAAPGAPDVLLIVLDTVRAASLGLHGHPRPTTPRLGVWARTGVRFDRALSTAPWTLASHASLFTGRLPHELSAGWLKALDGTYPTLAEVLASHGYATAGFAANTTYCTEESGITRGFSRFEDFPISLGEVIKSSSLGRAVSTNELFQRLIGTTQLLGRKCADDVNRDALSWVDGEPRSRPLFVFLNYFDAHAPYLPPAPFRDLFGPLRSDGTVRHSPGREGAHDWLPEEVQPAQDDYDRTIAYLDDRVAGLFDGLRQRGRLANTLVILTSDHGEEFGEHGFVDHGSSLYIASVHVPLIVSWPGRVPADRVVEVPVSLRDLPATVTELLGLSPAIAFPGRSLSRFWRDGDRAPEEAVVSQVPRTPNAPERAPVSQGDLHSLVLDGFRYIHFPAGRPELYDLDVDPGERIDLAARPDRQAQLQRFQERARALGLPAR